VEDDAMRKSALAFIIITMFLGISGCSKATTAEMLEVAIKPQSRQWMVPLILKHNGDQIISIATFEHGSGPMLFIRRVEDDAVIGELYEMDSTDRDKLSPKLSVAYSLRGVDVMEAFHNLYSFIGGTDGTTSTAGAGQRTSTIVVVTGSKKCYGFVQNSITQTYFDWVHTWACSRRDDGTYPDAELALGVLNHEVMKSKWDIWAVLIEHFDFVAGIAQQSAEATQP
jgi:hypothetical protein